MEPWLQAHRRILFLAALVVVYLVGFVPTWLKLRDQTAQRDKAEQALDGRRDSSRTWAPLPSTPGAANTNRPAWKRVHSLPRPV